VQIPFLDPCLYVETPEGQKKAEIGDWIVMFPAAFRVLSDDEFTAAFEEAPAPRMRPGDQPLPVPNDRPSSHDLVIADIALCAALDDQKTAAAELIAARKKLGLERYGSLLQAGNGRDCRIDLNDEIADACCYAKTWLEETGEPLASDLDRVYRQLLHLLCLTAGGLP
jgi:hypothetical protein